MTTLPLLHHEIAALPGLRAVWRPVEPVKWMRERDVFGYTECWRTRWATVWPNGVWHTWDADGGGGENDREQTVERAMAAALFASVRQGFLSCPYGQPGDEVVCEWKATRRVVSVPLGGPDDVSEVLHTRRCRISSVDVRRVAEMDEREAVEWGCYAANLSGFTAANRSRSTTAAEMACGVWHANWPAAEWAWVIGVTQEEARCQSTK
jgi:hypothetical protein